MLSFLYNISKITIILILPFCLLIRGAVFMHFNQGYSSYISLLFSSIATAVLLFIYFSVVYGRFTKGRASSLKYLRRRFAVAFVFVGGFVLYGIVFLSTSNSKTTEVNQEFYSLQPILRLGSSTLFLLDRKAIVTDASRMPEDYSKMGLKTNARSLHFKQKDGFAYAHDLRTKGRSELRNSLLRGYYWLMGFKTIRHVGTADHLHVYMPCRYR